MAVHNPRKKAQSSHTGTSPRERPTEWWLATLRRRAERLYSETLDLRTPVVWSSAEEQEAAVRFFNAAYRAEESGLKQAHELADEIAAWDDELAQCLRLYGNEEGWHRELLSAFLPYLGGHVRPMGPVTSTFYHLYGRAERMESIVLTNLMFETIGSTTYRLALRHVRHPTIRQLLTILARDESFHVPLNVHFLKQVLRRQPAERRPQLRRLYHLLFVSLLGSAAASRLVAQRFDGISFPVLARGYAEYLGRLFLHETELDLKPSSLLLRLCGLQREALVSAEAACPAVSIAAAEAAAEREQVVVTAL